MVVEEQNKECVLVAQEITINRSTVRLVPMQSSRQRSRGLSGAEEKRLTQTKHYQQSVQGGMISNTNGTSRGILSRNPDIEVRQQLSGFYEQMMLRNSIFPGSLNSVQPERIEKGDFRFRLNPLITQNANHASSSRNSLHTVKSHNIMDSSKLLSRLSWGGDDSDSDFECESSATLCSSEHSDDITAAEGKDTVFPPMWKSPVISAPSAYNNVEMCSLMTSSSNDILKDLLETLESMSGSFYVGPSENSCLDVHAEGGSLIDKNKFEGSDVILKEVLKPKKVVDCEKKAITNDTDSIKDLSFSVPSFSEMLLNKSEGSAEKKDEVEVAASNDFLYQLTSAKMREKKSSCDLNELKKLVDSTVNSSFKAEPSKQNQNQKEASKKKLKNQKNQQVRARNDPKKLPKRALCDRGMQQSVTTTTHTTQANLKVSCESRAVQTVHKNLEATNLAGLSSRHTKSDKCVGVDEEIKKGAYHEKATGTERVVSRNSDKACQASSENGGSLLDQCEEVDSASSKSSSASDLQSEHDEELEESSDDSSLTSAGKESYHSDSQYTIEESESYISTVPTTNLPWTCNEHHTIRQIYFDRTTFIKAYVSNVYTRGGSSISSFKTLFAFIPFGKLFVIVNRSQCLQSSLTNCSAVFHFKDLLVQYVKLIFDYFLLNKTAVEGGEHNLKKAIEEQSESGSRIDSESYERSSGTSVDLE